MADRQGAADRGVGHRIRAERARGGLDLGVTGDQRERSVERLLAHLRGLLVQGVFVEPGHVLAGEPYAFDHGVVGHRGAGSGSVTGG